MRCTMAEEDFQAGCHGHRDKCPVNLLLLALPRSWGWVASRSVSCLCACYHETEIALKTCLHSHLWQWSLHYTSRKSMTQWQLPSLSICRRHVCDFCNFAVFLPEATPTFKSQGLCQAKPKRFVSKSTGYPPIVLPRPQFLLTNCGIVIKYKYYAIWK